MLYWLPLIGLFGEHANPCIYVVLIGVQRTRCFDMTKDVIDSHKVTDRLVGYVSDTPTTMKALWKQLQKEYPKLTIVGCMDHCLDLFLKDCKDIMQVCTIECSAVFSSSLLLQCETIMCLLLCLLAGGLGNQDSCSHCKVRWPQRTSQQPSHCPTQSPPGADKSGCKSVQ